MKKKVLYLSSIVTIVVIITGYFSYQNHQVKKEKEKQETVAQIKRMIDRSRQDGGL